MARNETGWGVHWALCLLTGIPGAWGAFTLAKHALGMGAAGWDGVGEVVFGLLLFGVAVAHSFLSTPAVSVLGGTTGRVMVLHAITLPLAVGATWLGLSVLG